MKYLKGFNESKIIDTSSHELFISKLEDFCEESLAYLLDYDDNLTGLTKWDKVLLQRILDDSDLVAELDEIGSHGSSRDNAFDDDPFS